MNHFEIGQIFYGVIDKMLVECSLIFHDTDSDRLYFKSTKSGQSFGCSFFELGHSLYMEKEDAKKICKYEEYQKFYHVDTNGTIRMCALLYYQPNTNSMVFRDMQSKVEFKGNEDYIGKTLFDSAADAIKINESRLKKTDQNSGEDSNHKEKAVINDNKKQNSSENAVNNLNTKKSIEEKNSSLKDFTTQIYSAAGKVRIKGKLYRLGRHIFIPIAYNKVDHARIVLDKSKDFRYVSLITLEVGTFKEIDENVKFFYNIDVATSKAMKFPNPNKTTTSMVPTSAVFSFTRSSRHGDGSKKMSRPKSLPKALQGKQLQHYNEDD